MGRSKQTKQFRRYETLAEAIQDAKTLVPFGRYAYYIQVDEIYFKIGYTRRLVETLKRNDRRIRSRKVDGEDVHHSGIVGILGPHSNAEASISIVRSLFTMKRHQARRRSKKVLNEVFPSTAFMVPVEKCEAAIIRNL